MRSYATFDAATLLVTTEGCGVRSAADWTAPGVQSWLAAVVASRVPWYLVTWRRSRHAPFESLVMAWPDFLVALLEQLESHRFVSLQVLVADDVVGWRMFLVKQVWKPTDAERRVTGPVVLDVSGLGMRDAALEPVKRNPARTVLARVSARARAVFNVDAGLGPHPRRTKRKAGGEV